MDGSGEISGPVEEIFENPHLNCPYISHRYAPYVPSVNRLLPALLWDSKLCWIHRRSYHTILPTSLRNCHSMAVMVSENEAEEVYKGQIIKDHTE